jgi:translation initiation factor IF-2
MSEPNVIRLNKAAREFNVGRETIVEFLGKKGFKIDLNPNTKLTPEMVKLLAGEFDREKSVKEEARKKGLSSTKHETISLEDRKRQAPETDEPEDFDSEVIIRGISVEVDEQFKRSVQPHSADETPEPKTGTKEEKEVTTEELPKKEKLAEDLKPTDKEDTKTTANEKTDEPVPPKQTETKAEKPENTDSKKPQEKQTPETKEEDKNVKAQTIVEDKQEKTEAKADPEKVIEKADSDKKPATEEKAEKQDTKITEGQEAPKIEEVPEEPSKEAEKTEKEKTDFKVLGKIDLSLINERTKPPRKKPAEKKKEREAKKKTQASQAGAKTDQNQKTESTAPPSTPEVIKEDKKEVTTPPQEQFKEQKEPEKTPEKKAESKPEEDIFKPKIEKLAGLNILGKIELPVEKKPEKKKPVASSSDDKLKTKRKKRRRIKKAQEDKPAPTPAQTKQKQEDNKARAKQRNTKTQPGRKQRAEAKPELTEEEVSKQIKDTLARLSGAGKSKAAKYRRQKRDMVHKQMAEDAMSQEEEKKIITVAEFVTANELASMMNLQVTEIISVCMQLGLFVSINQRLDAETISLLAEEFGFSVKFESAEAVTDTEEDLDDPEDLKPRSPIVTVMGHVDHGKTKLLDYIRKANVVAGEAGGITQHIGAYEVQISDGKKITFLDTPGHEAFTAMRARGAKATDVAIIVIAADDNVMPQTVEAVNHAQAANVPIVFAINKIDKPNSNPEKIKEQLSQMNILVEEWGGKYQSQEISALGGLNIPELLEKVLLEAELLDLKANPDRPAVGTIVESSLDKGRGYISTLLVQNGTLKIGDVVLAGSHFGRIKAMYNERNQPVKEAGPSAPVLILGLNGAPQAGDSFKAMKDEREAKSIALKRQQLQREQGLRTQKHITLDEIGRRIAIGDFKELNIIVKGDVDGSVEALADSLLKQSTKEVQVNVIHKSVGAVTETDVMLASASNAIIIAFQVRPSVGARKLAEKEQIDIRTYSIIYSAIEEIKAAIEGMLTPKTEEKIVCNLEVRDTFKITKVGTIAGCIVLDGTIHRNTRIRIIRDGIVVYTGKLGSLKRFKDDVKEVQNGYECGLNIENFNDIKVGDIIEGFEIVNVARKPE